jgi:hypothetical protein
MFQSIGVRADCCPELPGRAAKWGAIVIFVGYTSMPLAVLSGFGRGYVAATPSAPVAAARGRE